MVHKMCQEGNAFLQHGTFAMMRHYIGKREELLEHDRSSGEKGEMEHPPHSFNRRNYVTQKNGRNAEIPPEESSWTT